MKRNSFEESEVPYQTLAKVDFVDFLHDSAQSEQAQRVLSLLRQFGLTHEMIEDLPMHALEDISNGCPSPVLPVSMEVNEGYRIKSRTRFALLRMADGNVDVMFYPVLKYAPLDKFTKEQQELLKQGKAVVADVDMPDGAHVKAFVQIDGETNQVMAVPTPVIGRNLQVLSDELSLGGMELKSIQNGEALTFAVEDEPVTVGIDLKSDTGIRFANGDGEQWRKEGKREWDKYTFGIYGCWVMDDDGNLDYVPEEEYTEELWNEQKKAAGRHASAVARK